MRCQNLEIRQIRSGTIQNYQNFSNLSREAILSIFGIIVLTTINLKFYQKLPMGTKVPLMPTPATHNSTKDIFLLKFSQKFDSVQTRIKI